MYLRWLFTTSMSIV